MSSNLMNDPALPHGGAIHESGLPHNGMVETTPYNGMVETTTLRREPGQHIHRRISWAAIFGGVILVVAVQIVLSTLGAAIGLGTVGVNAGTTPDAGSLGLGAGIWWVVSSVIALAFGGYVSAWLAGIELRWDGILHGMVTWGIATLMMIHLLTSAVGGIVGTGFSAIGGIASAAGGGLKSVAQPLAQASGITPDVMQMQAQAYMQPAPADPATMSPQDAQKDVTTNLVTFAKGGPDAAAAKERIVTVMAAQQHITHDEAAKRFDDAQAKLKQAQDQAVQTAKNAADASAAAASTTAFAAFACLVLGMVAASIGGAVAVQRRVEMVTRTMR